MASTIFIPFEKTSASSAYATKTVTAYGYFKIDWGVLTLPNIPQGSIRLRAVTGSTLYKGVVVPYDKTITLSQVVLAKGFLFQNVPANQQPMQLSISVLGPGYSDRAMYTATYKFYCSTGSNCGKLGTFTYHLIGNTITSK